MKSWIPALRIARREARRSRGRSALVLAMIALPVLALAFTAVTYDMFRLSPGEKFARTYGSADAGLAWPYAGVVQQDWSGLQPSAEGVAVRDEPATVANIRAVLPPGSRAIRYDRGPVELRTAAGIGELNAYALDAADPIATGLVRVVTGNAPASAGEVAVTKQAAQRLNTGLGGTVHAAHGAAAWRVTSIVEFPADLDEAVLFAAGALPERADGFAEPTTWLVDTPAPIGWSDVEHLNERGIVVASREVYLHPPSPAQTADPYDGRPDDRGTQVDVGLLVGGFVVLEVVMLVGPAFAVGARRRQRELALVAANGGTPGQLRRIMLADGVVLGAVAAVLGVALGIVAAFIARPMVEEHLMGVRAGGYRVFPAALLGVACLAVLTGVLAALVPAFTAARFNLVAALAGRRGVVRSRRRWPVVGLALLAVGVAVGGYGATRAAQGPVLAGLILVEAGLVLCTPVLIGSIARLGHLLPLSPRIALRDTARNRAAAAPAVAAVMAAVAGSVAIGVYLTSGQVQQAQNYRQGMPTGYVAIDYPDADSSTDRAAGAKQVVAAARTALPVRAVYETSWFACAGKASPSDQCALELLLPPQQRCPMLDLPQPYTVEQRRAALSDPRCENDSGRWTKTGESINSIASDGGLVSAITQASKQDVAEAARVLAAGGVVIRDARYLHDGVVTFAIRDTRKPGSGQAVPAEKLPQLSVPGYVLTSGVGGVEQTFLSPALVARAGLAVRPDGIAVATTRTPTQAEEDRLRAGLLAIDQNVSRFAYVEHGPDAQPDPRVLIIALVAGLIALGAAAIATGLAAADGQADLSILAAVGASPRVRRLLTLNQSGVIAILGALLGAGAGLGAAFAALAAYNQAITDTWPVRHPYPLVVPWQSLLVAAAVPLVAMLGAGLLTRSRLPIERRQV